MRPDGDVASSEGELSELHEGYALVWEELQEQRSAMAAAMAQCQALQEQVDATCQSQQFAAAADLTPGGPFLSPPGQ